MVTSVTLETFDGSSATYRFSYKDSKSFYRACNAPQACGGNTNTHECGDTSSVSYPVLTQVALPDGSAYTMSASDYLNQDGDCQTKLLNGHLTRLGLPTGGAFEWTWGRSSSRETPESSEVSKFTGGKESPFRQAAGIASRRHATPRSRARHGGTLVGNGRTARRWTAPPTAKL